jgi:hypothetical protein
VEDPHPHSEPIASSSAASFAQVLIPGRPMQACDPLSSRFKPGMLRNLHVNEKEMKHK